MPNKTISPSETATTYNWRQHLDIHPAAEYLPQLSHEELIVLGEDIRENGLQSPIVVLREGIRDPRFSLLDGRNRLDAMAAVGINFKFRRRRGRDPMLHLEFSGDDYIAPSLFCEGQGAINVVCLDEAEAQAFAISANLHRRHLTPGQKREVVAKVLKATPGLSNLTVAKQVKVDDKTVAKVRRELETTSEIPRLEKTVGADGKSRPTRLQIAKQVPDLARSGDVLSDGAVSEVISNAGFQHYEAERHATEDARRRKLSKRREAEEVRERQETERKRKQRIDKTAEDLINALGVEGATLVVKSFSNDMWDVLDAMRKKVGLAEQAFSETQPVLPVA